MDAYQSSIDSAGEPQGNDPMTDEEMHAIADEHLEKLGLALAKRRDEWVAARAASGVEKRWLEDIDQYNSRDESTKQAASMMEAVERGYPITNKQAKPQRSTVYINITRPKTNAAEARLANMLCPTDDRNWGIQPTPRPDLVLAAQKEAEGNTQEAAQMMQQGQGESSNASAAAMQGNGPSQGMPQPMQQPPMPDPAAMAGPQAQQPMVPGPQQGPTPPNAPQTPMAGAIASAFDKKKQTAIEQLAEAKRRAKSMQDEIDDQLIECDYNGQQRLMLHDCAVLGTGILKGPIVVNRVRKAWMPKSDGVNTVYVLEMVSEKKPASERVDPWCVFPDPSCGENIHDGIGVYEEKKYTSKQLRELTKQPGYIKKNIAKVLAEGPRSNLDLNQRDLQRQRDGNDAGREHYQVWEYWGEFKPEDLRAAGVEIADSSTEAISGCVILVNETVIKGFLNPIETGDLPYDFMVWEKVDGSCWGYGVPRLMNPAQRVLNAAWRQMMDNSGLSVGPQIVVNSNAVQPVDGKWELTGRKIWNLVDQSLKANDVFSSFDVPSHIPEIEKIIELAMRFADEESAVPMLAQGERGTAPETVGGMQLLMNSSNVVLSRMVKQFDDMVTRPHIRRYYDWNMAYNDKEEIKGDFQIDARGSSALLVRDMQSQALLQLGSFQGSGLIAPIVNWDAWFKEVLKAQHIDPTEIMKTDAEIAELRKAPPQPSPEMIRAQATIQAAQISAQAQLQTAQARTQGEMAYAQTEAQMAKDNHDARLEEIKLKRDLEMLKYANSRQQSLDQVKADLMKTALIERTKKELAAAEIQLAVTTHEKDRMSRPDSLQRDEISRPDTP